MSDRDRLLVAAAAIGLTFCALIWGAVGAGILLRDFENQYRQPYAATENDNPQRNSVEAIATAQAYQTCASADQRSGDQAIQRSKEDLCAQFLSAAAASRSAGLSRWQTIIGVGGLAAVLFTLGLNAVATFAANDQARTARRALEDLERPYLLTNVKQIPHGYNALFREKKDRLPFDTGDKTQYRFRNHGRSPAMIAHYYAHLVARWLSSGPPPPIDALSHRGLPAPHGVIVSVGKQSQKFDTHGVFQPADPALKGGEDDRVAWYLIGYVIYQDMMGSQYVAGFCHFYVDHGQHWYLLGTGGGADPYNYDKKIQRGQLPRAAWRAPK